MPITRREALAGMGAGVVVGCKPEARDSADTAAADAPPSVDTIVVLMMENRSFDHFFGARKLLEGKAEDGLTADMANLDSAGDAHPVAPNVVDCLNPDPPHGWSPSHRQYNDGLNDGFVTEYGDRPEVMHYLPREQAPVSWALADAYTNCDRYFASVMGPTWPNRFYAHAGTSDGRPDNDWPEGGAFTFTTVWNKLDDAGVAWKYYYTDVPFIGLFAGHFRPGQYAFVEDFVNDAAAGRLPPVVWIDPGFSYNSDHPPQHVGLGQEFIAAIYAALAASPQWERCLFVITYDEHGGFFDHVPPPTTEDDFAALGFDQMGFRVPTVVIGPWVKQGVSSVVFDHASWIKLVCERFGIEPWNARIGAASSLGEVLDLDRMARRDPLPAIELPAFDIDDSAVGDECFYGAFSPMPPMASSPWQAQWAAYFPKEVRFARMEAVHRELRRRAKALVRPVR